MEFSEASPYIPSLSQPTWNGFPKRKAASGYQKKQGMDTQQGSNTPVLNMIPPLVIVLHIFKQFIHFGCQEIILSQVRRASLFYCRTRALPDIELGFSVL